MFAERHAKSLGRGVLVLHFIFAGEIDHRRRVGIQHQMHRLRIGTEKLDVHDAIVHLMDLPHLGGDDDFLKFFYKKV